MSASIRTRRTLATGLSAVLVTAGVAAVAPAHAATGPVTYSCTTTLGPTDLTVDIDSSLPTTKIYAGEPVPVTITSTGSLPGSFAKQIATAGFDRFSGTVEANTAIDGTPATASQSIPVTPLGDQSAPGGAVVPFTASGPFNYTAKTPGTSTFTTSGFTANLVLHRPDGTTQPATATCTAPAGRPPVIDTVPVVAKSVTNLALSRTTAGYGQAVTVTAKVTTTGGSPAGTVAFVVDGVKTEIKVDKDGVAQLVLDDLTLGGHQVSATFVPSDKQLYEGSADGPDTLRVVKAGTRTRLAISGKTTPKVTRATAKVSGNFGTVPTGKVKFVLRKLGQQWQGFVKVRTRALVDGKASASFGKLGKGRYKLRAVYKGDANHTRSKAVKKFRERRP
ncbi:hypothetical protein DDE18_08850 [Nocardioides gansuensis]|uniref:Bacterial Ig-like domain-containing protein n=1 Tax=Nocardioides gansuensis TaxID=2138300 RepID=A0A2T8FCE6_9ACTN|nr:Ig-like domain repeat protein [Nocardioides gansuensis]PVG83388.1 hypothetical protein DDE18_08850 [Nocardioides gansuensis]